MRKGNPYRCDDDNRKRVGFVLEVANFSVQAGVHWLPGRLHSIRSLSIDSCRWSAVLKCCGRGTNFRVLPSDRSLAGSICIRGSGCEPAMVTMPAAPGSCSSGSPAHVSPPDAHAVFPVLAGALARCALRCAIAGQGWAPVGGPSGAAQAEFSGDPDCQQGEAEPERGDGKQQHAEFAVVRRQLDGAADAILDLTSDDEDLVEVFRSQL